MVVTGHVRNGVIVLDNDTHLPEGEKVSVAVVDPLPASEQRYYGVTGTQTRALELDRNSENRSSASER